VPADSDQRIKKSLAMTGHKIHKDRNPKCPKCGRTMLVKSDALGNRVWRCEGTFRDWCFSEIKIPPGKVLSSNAIYNDLMHRYYSSDDFLEMQREIKRVIGTLDGAVCGRLSAYLSRAEAKGFKKAIDGLSRIVAGVEMAKKKRKMDEADERCRQESRRKRAKKGFEKEFFHDDLLEVCKTVFAMAIVDQWILYENFNQWRENVQCGNRPLTIKIKDNINDRLQDGIDAFSDKISRSRDPIDQQIKETINKVDKAKDQAKKKYSKFFQYIRGAIEDVEG